MNGAAPSLAPWDRNMAGVVHGEATYPVSAEHRFAMPGWHVWCGSVLENPDGTFSLFFSCWPESRGHDGWVTHSQIWRAEGEFPWGPFRNPTVVFAGAEARTWDADNFHNVTVKQFGDRYFLYYTGNFGNGEWWVHRNNQRIGVAVADSPRGPWRRASHPVLDISRNSWDSLCVANPTVTNAPDGRFMMIYKGVTTGDLPYGSRVLHGVAFAEAPDGPFTKADGVFFEVPGLPFPFEDPHVWFRNERFRCLMKDMTGLPGSCPRAILLFESADGLHWPTDQYRLVATPHLQMSDGEIVRVDRLERPGYFAHPKLSCLSFAVKPLGEAPSFLVFAPGRVSDRARIVNL